MLAINAKFAAAAAARAAAAAEDVLLEVDIDTDGGGRGGESPLFDENGIAGFFCVFCLTCGGTSTD